MEKEKVEYLSLYRAMAIAAVVLIHSTSQPVAAAQTSDLYYIYVFLNIAAKFAVPSFICLTAFVLFYNYAHKGLKPAQILSFYYKRLKYILVPYFIASLCYFVFVQFIRGDISLNWAQLRLFGEDLLTGTAYTHLYYIVIIVQFYLLFPLHLLASRSRTFVKYSIWIGLLLQWSFVLLNKYEWQLPRTGSIFLPYMSIWMLGAFLGIHWERYRAWLESLFNPAADLRYMKWNRLLWLSWAVVTLTHVQAWYMTHLEMIVMNTLIYEGLFKLQSLLSCLVLIQAASLIQRRGKALWVRLMHGLGEVSFGIYLLHPVLLFIYRKLPWHRGSPWLYPLWIAGGFVVALGLTWLIVAYLSRRLPMSWIFFGSNAKPPSVHQHHSSISNQATDGRHM